jgi:hypothetical protein
LVALVMPVVGAPLFLNCGSELVLPSVELANLFFFGVVIRFSLLEVLSLSVAYVESWLSMCPFPLVD